LVVAIVVSGGVVQADGKWEVTAASEEAAALGLEWLARNQGKEGNWGSHDLGLVSVGALAFLSAGHSPETGKYKENVRRALDYVLSNAKSSGLLNISGKQRDMYNHGLSTFVLTQAYGLSNDKRVGRALRKAIKIILDTQCRDGGWTYHATRQERGHDLSLAVMQAKALRGAMDIGIHIPRETITTAIKSVQGYYRSKRTNADDMAKRFGWRQEDARYPGRFTYNGGSGTTAMAAAGAVCLQEFGKYKDYRIRRSMQGVLGDIQDKNRMKVEPGRMPFDAYTMYYVSQALYQVGGDLWQKGYPQIRKALVDTQTRKTGGGGDKSGYGSWSGKRVGGVPGQLFATSVAVFTLNIPNRYLPILQQGKSSSGRRTRRTASTNTKRYVAPDTVRKKRSETRDTIRSEEPGDSPSDPPAEVAARSVSAADRDKRSKNRKVLTE